MLNRAISERCAGYALCRVMPFERIYHQVVGEGGIVYRGKRYRLADLVPDGLHLSSVAGDYLADELERLFDSSRTASQPAPEPSP